MLLHSSSKHFPKSVILQLCVSLQRQFAVLGRRAQLPNLEPRVRPKRLSVNRFWNSLYNQGLWLTRLTFIIY